MKNRSLVWIANCPVVTGYARGCVYDLIRERYSLVPNGLKILSSSLSGEEEMVELLSTCDKTDNEIIAEYTRYAIEMEYAVEIPSSFSKLFQPIVFSWDDHAMITNCIIDNSGQASLDILILRTLPLLEIVRCGFVQVRFLEPCELSFVERVLSAFDTSIVNHIQVLLPYVDDMKLGVLEQTAAKYGRLNSIRIYGNYMANNDVQGNLSRPILFIGKKLEDYSPERNRMVVNMKLYCESQEYNTYYNRKMYIDSLGFIKNAPEIAETGWNITQLKDNEQLLGIIHANAYTKLWKVRKDDIHVCRDCEFRHMCVDRVVPVRREDGTFYRKQECNYNPYICKWKSEEGYRALAECGVVSNAEGFSIDHERIAAINAELWGE